MLRSVLAEVIRQSLRTMLTLSEIVGLKLWIEEDLTGREIMNSIYTVVIAPCIVLCLHSENLWGTEGVCNVKRTLPRNAEKMTKWFWLKAIGGPMTEGKLTLWNQNKQYKTPRPTRGSCTGKWGPGSRGQGNKGNIHGGEPTPNK